MLDKTRFITRVSQFFPPTPGSRNGKCIICAHYTEKGHDVDFSGNFTSWNLLQEGNCICEYCYTLCRDQQYRRKSWVASLKGVRFLKRDEILPVLLEPPEPPFAVYITKSGKKQGFLHIVNRVNYNKNHYCIAFEDSILFVERSSLREMVEIARQARNLKFSKSELLNGPSAKHWEYKELCMKIEHLSRNPVWEVVVFAV